jgi:hypothetical protein
VRPGGCWSREICARSGRLEDLAGNTSIESQPTAAGSMFIHLPHTIDLYVKAENSGDVELLSECFAPTPPFTMKTARMCGLAAIKEWKAETKKKYNHTVAPLDVAHRDGKTILEAKLTGNFPGSPVTLEFSFALKAGKIVSLEIH